MKVILSIGAFACFAVMYGIALLTTNGSERSRLAEVPVDEED